MVTFGTRADRRNQPVSKDVLNAREAGLLLARARDKGCELNGPVAFVDEELKAAAGLLWQKKTHKYMLNADHTGATLDGAKLLELATSPLHQMELADMVVTFFRGAARAMNYINGRKKNPSLPQHVGIPQAHIERTFGPFWRERFNATGLSYA